MKLKNVISASQFSRRDLNLIFATTDKIKNNKFNQNVLSGKIMATLFYEPSTRTRLSFESAMLRLGGSYIATENAKEFSSAIKGESLEDTIRIINMYSDLIVIRHPTVGAAQLAALHSKVPVINAGDGSGEHPTQALLDLYTIITNLKKENFTISIIGDLANYRSTHSLSQLLTLFKKVKIIYVSPKSLKIPRVLKENLKNNNINFEETEDFNKGISEAEVIYQTRIPKEYLSRADYNKFSGRYILNSKTIKFLKKKSIIMHPLPRVDEINTEIDTDRRAVYFDQAQNGLYIRMALLKLIFDKR